MFNQIKADSYRQLHTRGSYIILALTVLLSVLITAFESTGGIMINADTMQEFEGSRWSVMTGLKSATLSSTMLLYIDIALFVIVIGQEFSKKTYKNTLISGISRIGFILGKFVTMLLDILFLTLIFYGVVILTSLLAGRDGGASLMSLVRTLGLMTVTIGFFISVIFSIGVIVLVLANSVVTATICMALWPILIAILSNFTSWRWLRYINFTGVAQQITLGTLKIDALWPYIGVSFGVLILTIVGSALIIQRKEL
ncbi:ABC transporter permease [Levilactobacillus fujinensis]|uniref:ABC transporter permease n=1 Tax=Levilactobacillus fujinensis TaxID=2486024 RepID=A0ABW1THD1_9LACO|nr:ABC transporter permease [Levilactobacillus fujinensis]